MNLSTPMSGVLYTKPTHVFSTPISGGQQLISSLTDLSPIGANDFGHATQAAAGSIRFQEYWSVENPAQKYLSEVIFHVFKRLSTLFKVYHHILFAIPFAMPIRRKTLQSFI